MSYVHTLQEKKLLRRQIPSRYVAPSVPISQEFAVSNLWQLGMGIFPLNVNFIDSEFFPNFPIQV